MEGERAQLRAEAVYRDVRQDLLAARYAPGQWIKVAQLQRDFGVSVSVIREALSRLASEGLLTFTANRGFRVVELSMEDLQELTEARIRIEVIVLASSIANGDGRWEAELIASHHLLESTPLIDPETQRFNPKWAPVHAAFHQALLAGCPNRRMVGMVNALRDSAELYRMWSPKVHVRASELAAEHRSLMKLALERRTEECQALLESHIGQTSRALGARIATTPSPAEAGSSVLGHPRVRTAARRS